MPHVSMLSMYWKKTRTFKVVDNSQKQKQLQQQMQSKKRNEKLLPDVKRTWFNSSSLAHSTPYLGNMPVKLLVCLSLRTPEICDIGVDFLSFFLFDAAVETGASVSSTFKVGKSNSCCLSKKQRKKFHSDNTPLAKHNDHTNVRTGICKKTALIEHEKTATLQGLPAIVPIALTNSLRRNRSQPERLLTQNLLPSNLLFSRNFSLSVTENKLRNQRSVMQVNWWFANKNWKSTQEKRILDSWAERANLGWKYLIN